MHSLMALVVLAVFLVSSLVFLYDFLETLAAFTCDCPFLRGIYETIPQYHFHHFGFRVQRDWACVLYARFLAAIGKQKRRKKYMGVIYFESIRY